MKNDPALEVLSLVRRVLIRSQEPYSIVNMCVGFIDSLIKQKEESNKMEQKQNEEKTEEKKETKEESKVEVETVPETEAIDGEKVSGNAESGGDENNTPEPEPPAA